MKKKYFFIAILIVATIMYVIADDKTDEKIFEKHGYLKGQLHAHSNYSGDSKTDPKDVIKFYNDNKFDFIFFTDHNKTHSETSDNLQVFDGIEYTDFVRYFDGPIKKSYSTHMNGIFINNQKVDAKKTQKNLGSAEESYIEAITKIKEWRGIPILNHPNVKYSCDKLLLEKLVKKGLKHFEVYNMAVDSQNEGDEDHISTEEMWDYVLSQGLIVYGVATDDAHHYYDAEQLKNEGREYFVGNRGWIMVKTKRNDENHIRKAIENGSFYCSSGVYLKNYSISDNKIEIEVDAKNGNQYTINFIGKNGKVLKSTNGTSATYNISKDDLYVRVKVTDTDGKFALTQPYFPKLQK